MEFTEKETLQDALIAHKFIMHMYCQLGIECSNKKLRDLIMELNKTASEHDLKIFRIMNENGFYPVTLAGIKEIKQTLKMHEKMQEELEQKIK